MAVVKRGRNTHACHKDECELIEQVRLFEKNINSMPLVVADRLWTKTSLNLDDDKLQFSKKMGFSTLS